MFSINSCVRNFPIYQKYHTRPMSLTMSISFSERENKLLSDAILNLDNDNIIVCERHDRANARFFLIKLIESGKVDNIYLELPDLTCDLFGGDERTKFSMYLNDRKYDDLMQNSLFNEFSSDCSAITGSKDNEISLPTLILFAKMHCVEIHFIDNKVPKKKNIIEKVKERNEGMATSFNKIKKDSNGVILVGANHCRLDTKNLHKLCGISESLIYDLSE
ncbi:hypothetical protein ND38_003305 [Escherichia coli]|nr:hypothetical protein [Escherichia coli]EKG8116173.1 hypothetical protein [Escherichia coli]